MQISREDGPPLDEMLIQNPIRGSAIDENEPCITFVAAGVPYTAASPLGCRINALVGSTIQNLNRRLQRIFFSSQCFGIVSS